MVEISYALYLIISIGITIWVARTLSRNGEVFLVQCFGHNKLLAQSTNHLLVVGFYLVNIGFITLTLSLGDEPTTLPEAIRFLSAKVGLAVMILGGMHFFNMTAIARYGRKVNDWLLNQELSRTIAAAE
jgi:hypothetical protein